MDVRDEAAALDEAGAASTTLDDLVRRGTLASHDDGHWTLVHRCVVGRVSFRSRQTEIRLGISKNPVVAQDGTIVLETAFPRDQIVLPPVPRPETPAQARAAVEAALALSRAPRAEDAVRLLEAAAALVLGAAGAVRGILRTGGRGERWSVETEDGKRHALAREIPARHRGALSDRGSIGDVSDLSIPAAVLHRIPWCGVARPPAEGTILETTAHARLAARETVLQIAPTYGLDPAPWIS